jgi:hypothetical protein
MTADTANPARRGRPLKDAAEGARSMHLHLACTPATYARLELLRQHNGCQSFADVVALLAKMADDPRR